MKVTGKVNVKKAAKGDEPIPSLKIIFPKKGKGSYSRKPKHSSKIECDFLSFICFNNGGMPEWFKGTAC